MNNESKSIEDSDIISNNLETNKTLKSYTIAVIVFTFIELVLLQLTKNNITLKTETTLLSVINTNLLLLVLLYSVYKYYISVIILGLNSFITIIYYKIQDNILNTDSESSIALNTWLLLFVMIVLTIMVCKVQLKNKESKGLIKNKQDLVKNIKLLLKEIDTKYRELVSMSTLYKALLSLTVVSVIITEVNQTRFSLKSDLDSATFILLVCMTIQYILPIAMLIALLFKSEYFINLANVYIVSYIISTVFITMYYTLDIFYILNSIIGTVIIVKLNKELKIKDMKKKIKELK